VPSFRLGRCTRQSVLSILFGTVVHATTVTLTITSGTGQFPGKQAAVFGPVTGGTLTLNLTPNVPVNFPVGQFSGFQGLNVFPPTVGANTTFQQTITVNGMSATVTRTITVQDNGSTCFNAANPGGGLEQAIAPGPTLGVSPAPSIFTFDLGALGKVDVNLTLSQTLAVGCSFGVPNNALIVIPGTTEPTILLHDVPGQPIATPLPPTLLLTLTGVAGAGLYEARRRWLARFRVRRVPG
jgi:hypothetical protein